MMESEGSAVQSVPRRRIRRFLVALPCAVLLAIALIWWLWPRPDPLYTVTILPSLGGRYTMPHSINDRGQVAGVSKLADGADHLFLWDRGKGMRDLGPVLNDRVLINNVGQIAATMRDPNDDNRAFVWDPNSGRRMLPTLGREDKEGEPWGLNNLGVVVGISRIDSGPRHAFVWDETHGIRHLAPSAAKPTRPFGINDAGQILVFVGNASLLITMKEDGTLSSQPAPIYPALHINNAGQIVGHSRKVKGRIDVLLWHPDSGTETVAHLKGSFPGMPRINDAGQVYYSQGQRPRFTLFGRRLLTTHRANYLWDPQKGSIALDACVPIERGSDLHISGLNTHGCLVGAVQSGGASRIQGVLLEPIPERWEK